MHVLDENDNNPIFDPTEYPIGISESTTEGSNVIQVLADDADIGTNGRLVFDITSGNTDGKQCDSAWLHFLLDNHNTCARKDV